MWIITTLVVHVLLLGSIFVIYFRSPVITGLQPQSPITKYGLEAPAKRLVLIVTDGLRADSFFRNNCSDVPHMADLMRKYGSAGVSHTRVPTESRPGHIALIAGLYEDPSAVTRGWKENPTDFDSVFNRSGHTFAWGANDVVRIFSRYASKGMHVLTYDHELDFSGTHKTYDLDKWVFTKVRTFLKQSSAQLVNAHPVVFFLHLLGLDTAGHVHKPNSKLFLENLHYTDAGIAAIYNDFEEAFADGRTAYLVTSDHGMTNAGSHGAGERYETETPFFVWGAGIARSDKAAGQTFNAGAGVVLPLHEIEQAQLTPLMTAVLGLPPPMNNFGVLPLEFLKASSTYRARAVQSNALQLVAQFEALLGQHESGLLTPFLRSYKNLTSEDIAIYKRTSEAYLKANGYERVIADSYLIMNEALTGIDYYHGYYRNVLLFSTTATIVGWITYLLQLLTQRGKGDRKQSLLPKVLYAIAIILLVFAIVQRVPLLVVFYLILPVFVWLLVAQKSLTSLTIQLVPLLPYLFAIILCAELLVYTFYERRLITPAYMLFALVNNWNSFLGRGAKSFIWLSMVIVLSMFPLLPLSVGYRNESLLALSAFCLIARPFVTKSHLDLKTKLISAVALGNGLLCMVQHMNQIGISYISLAISWCYLFYSILSIILNPTVVLKHRVELICFNLTTLYTLLCTSYESLFVLLLSSELMLNISSQHLFNPIDIEKFSLAVDSVEQLQTSFRLAFATLLYTFFSFFGTGNFASISSFDPNIIRCFLTTFSPFLIMALVILKLIIPVVMNISIIFGMSSFMRANKNQIFICMLLICDVMSLNFLFLVQNRGSWLEIGTSISHFVIMKVTTLVLVLFTSIAKVLLALTTPKFWMFKQK